MSIEPIRTPRGEVIVVDGTRAELRWFPGMANRWNDRYSAAQQMLDSEILRRTTPYVPLRTSMLIKSGILGTVVGSGEVAWIAPYARKQYYDTAGTRTYDAKRGGHWFARMMAAEGPALIASVRRQFGR